MSIWDSRFSDHLIWGVLKSLDQAVNSARSREGNPIEAVEGLERIRAVLKYVERRLAAVEPQLAHPGALDAMVGPYQEAVNLLNTFIASGDATQVNLANKQMDAASASLQLLPVTTSKQDLAGIGESAASYRKAVEEHLRSLTATITNTQVAVDGLRATVATLQESADREREKVASLSAEFHTQFTTAQGTRFEEGVKAEAARKESADAALASQAIQFTATQNAQRAAFEALFKEHTDRLEAQSRDFAEKEALQLSNHQKALEELTAKYAASANKILEEIEADKVKVEKLLGVIGSAGISSGYKKTADNARIALIVWQVATVLSLLLLIGAALYSFGPLLVDGKSIPIELLVAKFLVTLTVGILAAYAGNQADKQYQIEKRNRRLALEFEALGAYLAPLPVDQQAKFRYEVGERTFGRGDDGKGNEKSPVTIADFFAEIQKDPTLVDKAKSLLGDVWERIIRRKE